jgi:transposase, IS5 family
MYLFCQNTLKSDKQIIFEHTELGALHQALPLQQLAALLPKKVNTSGAPGWVDAQGMIAMLFLQPYSQLSDRKFIDHFNGNWQWQMFCGVQLQIHQPIRDRNLMSRIRKYVSHYLDLEKFQQILISHWKPVMTNTHVGMSDATAYESQMRYPTDVKLLWECCQYLQSELQKLNEQLGVKASYKNFEKKRHQYLTYARRRKKPYRLTQRVRRNFFNQAAKLKDKLQIKLNVYLNKHTASGLDSVFKKLHTIKQILAQQEYLIRNKGSKVEDRILSLYKPYVRAIVRGKETKAVEFGAKVHMMQIDGVNYIEHFSYKAFNETTRFKWSILKHKQLFGECTHWSADRIYATNKNRVYASSQNIMTNFVAKGHPKNDPQEKQMKALLNKESATRLEGSFGVEKNYYGLSKVKARTASTEKLCIYFAVMLANAVRICHRQEWQHKQAA